MSEILERVGDAAALAFILIAMFLGPILFFMVLKN